MLALQLIYLLTAETAEENFKNCEMYLLKAMEEESDLIKCCSNL